LHIVCTATGAPPPIGTSRTKIWRFEATDTAYPWGFAAVQDRVKAAINETLAGTPQRRRDRRPRRQRLDQGPGR
jgi:hypothetical protein